VISNEIFRRLHPEGWTFGEYLRNTICPMLNLPGELLSGATDEECKTVHPIELASGGYLFKRVWNGNYGMGSMSEFSTFAKEVTA